MCQAAQPLTARSTRTLGTPMANLRLHRFQANVFNARRASFKVGRLPLVCSIIASTSSASSPGVETHPCAAMALARESDLIATLLWRNRLTSFFNPCSTRLLIRRSRVRRIPAAEAGLIFRKRHSNTASRCFALNRSSAESISGVTRSHKVASGDTSRRRVRPSQRQKLERAGSILRQTTLVIWKSQLTSTVFFRSLDARRANTRKTARVTSDACTVSLVRRNADE